MSGVYASLLRGINVGRNMAIGMPALAKVYQDLGLTGVKTLLRSGNVVFRGSCTAQKLEDAIEKKFRIRPKVILRTAKELEAAIRANPWPDVARDDPAH